MLTNLEFAMDRRKKNVSRPLRWRAGRCRIVRHRSWNRVIFDLRLCRALLPFAALWCYERARKGQSQECFPTILNVRIGGRLTFR
jgi:hypothetical protein